jgi:hypothetical protein
LNHNDNTVKRERKFRVNIYIYILKI